MHTKQFDRTSKIVPTYRCIIPGQIVAKYQELDIIDAAWRNAVEMQKFNKTGILGGIYWFSGEGKRRSIKQSRTFDDKTLINHKFGYTRLSDKEYVFLVRTKAGIWAIQASGELGNVLPSCGQSRHNLGPLQNCLTMTSVNVQMASSDSHCRQAPAQQK